MTGDLLFVCVGGGVAMAQEPLTLRRGGVARSTSPPLFTNIGLELSGLTVGGMYGVADPTMATGRTDGADGAGDPLVGSTFRRSSRGD